MNDITLIQTLLDAEATICNSMHDLAETRGHLQKQIVLLRGTVPPHCYGLDDCSSLCLSTCAWRHDCGDAGRFAVDK
jgi:hypothetical protein